MVWAEFASLLVELTGREIPVPYGPWHPSDQLVYISGIAKAKKDFGWQPLVSKLEGIERLYKWVMENRELVG